ncbi:MAG: hypothetical protein ABFR97_05585 [Thermodesulfobacteriota bacterium]
MRPADRTAVAPRAVTPTVANKGATTASRPFQVLSVQFKEVTENNRNFLAAAITFNKEVDLATVQQNVNIRLLRKNDAHFWVDASTQNNNVRVMGNMITWASGATLDNGYYVMHLRGTIKSKDGTFLDCDKDGKGEGGSLPPYESMIFQVNIPRIEGDLPSELIDRLGR